MRNSGRWSRYCFLLPGIAIYFGVIVFPAFYSLYLSFYKWNGVSPVKEFVAFGNYARTLADPAFKKAALNNVKWVIMTMVFTVSAALFLATLINRQFKGRIIFRGIFYFPYILSGIVVGIIWSWIYQPQLGLLVNLGKTFRIPFLEVPYLAQPKTALYASYIASLWQTTGGPMILFLAGLQTVPTDLIEAAYIDGAGRARTFIYVTIPMLRETFVIVLATQIIHAVKVYDVIRALTNGGPARNTETMSMLMLNQTFRYADFGMGTALSWIMVIILSAIIVPYVLFMARD
jgi:raffinose/stachyose/melibiose transport system permease protein